MFAYNITISMQGIDKVSNNLKTIASELSNMSQPITDAGVHMLSKIDYNFGSHGALFGHPWKPLTRATVEMKKKSGFARFANEPLYRTGALYRGFRFKVTSPFSMSITNTQSYAGLHQNGGYVRFRGKIVKVPQRIMVALTETDRNTILNIFKTWVQILILRTSSTITTPSAPKKRIVSLSEMMSGYEADMGSAPVLSGPRSKYGTSDINFD